MLESTEEKKTGIIETVMGIIGDVSGKKPKFQIHYRPIDSDGKSTENLLYQKKKFRNQFTTKKENQKRNLY